MQHPQSLFPPLNRVFLGGDGTLGNVTSPGMRRAPQPCPQMHRLLRVPPKSDTWHIIWELHPAILAQRARNRPPSSLHMEEQLSGTAEVAERAAGLGAARTVLRCCPGSRVGNATAPSLGELWLLLCSKVSSTAGEFPSVSPAQATAQARGGQEIQRWVFSESKTRSFKTRVEPQLQSPAHDPSPAPSTHLPAP